MNPCAGVEFPVSIRGLFRPHYVTWSEQQMIEFHAPEHLRNVVRIITETGLRVYKELTPMKKDQVDLENAVVWIPDSKTRNSPCTAPGWGSESVLHLVCLLIVPPELGCPDLPRLARTIERQKE